MGCEVICISFPKQPTCCSWCSVGNGEWITTVSPTLSPTVVPPSLLSTRYCMFWSLFFRYASLIADFRSLTLQPKKSLVNQGFYALMCVARVDKRVLLSLIISMIQSRTAEGKNMSSRASVYRCPWTPEKHLFARARLCLKAAPFRVVVSSRSSCFNLGGTVPASGLHSLHGVI